ncbi:MEDS domain-containing protein [Bacillus sp. PK3_68]|uniref:MEDS domain-containing protein n=1 Tax=Bacillus sp. PK3_68 TaxID=2027408 RepID=UPI0015FFF2EC|nr:MEDS domain-containing protein [Bacillus sp. PK3_68]
MKNSIIEVIKDLKKVKRGHICYFYSNEITYINNVVSFIATGIRNGDHILLVENDRNILLINKRLEKVLSKKEWTFLHVMNNYDFYYFNKNFNPHTIVNHFLENIEPFLKEGASICTWGLIEWGEDKEIHQCIEEYEKEVDKITNEKGIISVCAYNAGRTPDSLKELLIKCHGITLTDGEAVKLK